MCVGVCGVVELLSVTLELGLVGRGRLIIWAVLGTPFSCCSWGQFGGSTSFCVGVGGVLELVLVTFKLGLVVHVRLIVGAVLGNMSCRPAG